MGFEITKSGYSMYKPSWQKNPGARMKQMNRAAAENYFANTAALGSNLLYATSNQSSSMIEITAKMVQDRLKADYSKKLEQAKAGLDVIL